MSAMAATHRDLQPHVDHLPRVVDHLQDLAAEQSRGLVHAVLDCIDDDLLPHLQECETVLYPALARRAHGDDGVIRVLRSDQRMIAEVRHELRALLAGDLDDRARLAIRERLFALRLLLRGHIEKHDELLVTERTERGAPTVDRKAA
jgi:hypothetical protein